MPNEEVRAALVVAASEYEDLGLRGLRSPAQDAEALAGVLADECVGDFDVQTLINQPQHLLLEELEGFFADRHREDLLLLYFSCHGIKDDAGHLYFATTNTKRHRLGSTAVSAEWLNRQIDRSRSSRVVLLLDCCYSGAFARGAKGDGVMAIKERFDGHGRVVLTASNAIEYSFEGEDLSGGGEPSIFTGALVMGLETGEADRGGDGLIDVDELYEYVYSKVREVTPNQTPGKWAMGVQGELYVARSRAPVRATPIPAELQAAMQSSFFSVREGAVAVLGEMLTSTHPGLAISARVELQRMADEDYSRRVSHAAKDVLDAAPAAADEVPPAMPFPCAVPQEEPQPDESPVALETQEPDEPDTDAEPAVPAAVPATRPDSVEDTPGDAPSRPRAPTPPPPPGAGARPQPRWREHFRAIVGSVAGLVALVGIVSVAVAMKGGGAGAAPFPDANEKVLLAHVPAGVGSCHRSDMGQRGKEGDAVRAWVYCKMKDAPAEFDTPVDYVLYRNAADLREWHNSKLAAERIASSTGNCQQKPPGEGPFPAVGGTPGRIICSSVSPQLAEFRWTDEARTIGVEVVAKKDAAAYTYVAQHLGELRPVG